MRSVDARLESGRAVIGSTMKNFGRKSLDTEDEKTRSSGGANFSSPEDGAIESA